MDLGRALFQLVAKEEMSAVDEISTQPRCEPMENGTQPQVSYVSGAGIDQEASSQRRDEKRNEEYEREESQHRGEKRNEEYEREKLRGHDR